MNADAARRSGATISVVPLASRPRLAPHVRLRFERARNRLFLANRGQLIELDATATDVVRMCTGQHTVRAIIRAVTGNQVGREVKAVAREVLGCLNALAGAALVLRGS